MDKLVSSVIAKIKTKYNYDDYMINILSSIIPSMIIYYGLENADKIINAFLNTPIKIVKDRTDGENFISSIGVKDKYRFPTFASGAYDEKFQLDANGNIERIPYVLLRDNNLNAQHFSIIVHELCHMVMNYGKTVINGNQIISKTGLITEKFEMVDGKPVSIYTSDEPFEEGLNEYDARRITELIFGGKFESTTYRLYYDYVSVLMNNENARKIVVQSRLNSDDNWKNILGVELSDEYKNVLNEYDSGRFDMSITEEERKIRRELRFKKLENSYNKVKEYMKNINISDENIRSK